LTWLKRAAQPLVIALRAVRTEAAIKKTCRGFGDGGSSKDG
jgi:hypothetical protein